VLGNIYEQYLGNILKSTPKRAKLESSKTHKKEQGIYYTPSYIVDYIVKNTVGEYIKTHTPEEIKKVRILDPACGSGSFLIKAYKELENYWKQNSDFAQLTLDSEEFYSKKVEILKNNIFGVDLDPKAVEIAQLNLLLQISEKGEKLPLLQNNIKVGNSLIDDPSITDKAFKWEEEFPEIMKEGGFDIIIGNPPYIKEYTNREIFNQIKSTKLGKYYQGKMDIWYLFASLSIDLLKENGLHSFIAQSNWITSFGASKLREKILKESQIISYLDFGNYKVFQGADIQTMIYVFKKQNINGSYLVDYFKVLSSNISEDKIKEFLKFSKIRKEYIKYFTVKFNPSSFLGKEIVFTDESVKNLLTKIRNESNYYLNPKDISTGIDVHQDFVIENHLKNLKDSSIKVGDGIFVIRKEELKKLNLTEKEMEIIRPYYTSNELTQYYGNPNNNLYIIYTKSNANKTISEYPNIKRHLDKFKEIITSDYGPYGLHRARKEDFFEGEKILSLRKARQPTFTYVDFPCYVSQSFFVIKPKDVNLRLLTGILNSKIVHFWLRNNGKIQGDNLQVDKEPLVNIPIKIPEKNSELEKSIVNKVDEIISLIKRMNTLSNSEGTKDLIKERIEREKENLNKLIYRLYGLNESQISYLNQF
jgi:adenine-specific DNA-methyltransferase